MATQKQRRKRAKEKRHAYDLVEIDAEGNETVLSAADLKADAPAKTSSTKSQATSEKPRVGRGAVQPPSWRRVMKRAAIFAPIFFATVWLLAGDSLEWQGAVLQTIFLVAVFVPFSYFMDRLVWRSHEKRAAKAKTGGR